MDTSRAKEVTASCCRLAIIILSLFVLVACGGGGNDDTTATTNTPDPVTDNPGSSGTPSPGDTDTAGSYALSATPQHRTAAQKGIARFVIQVKPSDATGTQSPPRDVRLDVTDSPWLVRVSGSSARDKIGFEFELIDDNQWALTFDIGSDVPANDYAFKLDAMAGEWSDALRLGLTVVTAPVPPTALGSWEEVPETHMREVCPPKPALGAGDCRYAIEAWSGGALDAQANRLYIFGGGHNDYYGNEVYAFDIDSRSWHRVTDPSPLPPDANTNCSPTLEGGKTPASRHTYNGLAWIAVFHKLFLYGGAYACARGSVASDTWLFDPQTAAWERLSETSGFHGSGQVIYDPVSKRVLAVTTYQGWGTLRSFDFKSDKWVKIGKDFLFGTLFRTGTLDTRRSQIWFVGQGTVNVLTLDGTTVQMQTVPTTGATAIVNTQSPGVAYDSMRDRIVAWCGGDDRCASSDAGTTTQADQVYWLNPETLEWTVDQPPGGPSWSQQRGTFGRWRYSPESDLFIAVNSADRNVWFYHPPSATAAN